MSAFRAHTPTENELAQFMKRMRAAADLWETGEKDKRTCYSCPNLKYHGDYGSPTYCACRRSDHYGHFVVHDHPACDHWGDSPDLVFHGLKRETNANQT